MVATDNIDTFACYIYPDAASTGNPNGGIDWLKSANQPGPSIVGFLFHNYKFSIPDSGLNSVTGIDGVRK